MYQKVENLKLNNQKVFQSIGSVDFSHTDYVYYNSLRIFKGHFIVYIRFNIVNYTFKGHLIVYIRFNIANYTFKGQKIKRIKCKSFVSVKVAVLNLLIYLFQLVVSHSL